MLTVGAAIALSPALACGLVAQVPLFAPDEPPHSGEGRALEEPDLTPADPTPNPASETQDGASDPAPVLAYTVDGRTAALRPDGTWSWSESSPPNTTPHGLPPAFRSDHSLLVHDSGRVAILAAPWSVVPTVPQLSADLVLQHVRHPIVGGLLVESAGLTPDELARRALQNIRRTSHSATLLRQEIRGADGEVRFEVRARMTENSPEIRYLMRGYADETHSVQWLVCGPETLIASDPAMVEDLFDDLEILSPTDTSAP